MKAISLIQPWATAIMIGNKSVETRSWKTSFVGRVAIHASKGFPKWARDFAETERALGRLPGRLPFGAIIGFGTIVSMKETIVVAPLITAIERLYGDYAPGRWCWMLSDIDPLPDDKIIPCKGKLGLWEVPADLNLAG